MREQRLLDSRILDELINTAKKLGISVRRERLFESEDYILRGGMCRIGENEVIFVNSRLPSIEQISLLAECIAPFVSDNIYLLPGTRAVIEKYNPARTQEHSGNV